MVKVPCLNCKGRGYVKDWRDIFLCVLSPGLVSLLLVDQPDQNSFGRKTCDACKGRGRV